MTDRRAEQRIDPPAEQSAFRYLSWLAEPQSASELTLKTLNAARREPLEILFCSDGTNCQGLRLGVNGIDIEIGKDSITQECL